MGHRLSYLPFPPDWDTSPWYWIPYLPYQSTGSYTACTYSGHSLVTALVCVVCIEMWESPAGTSEDPGQIPCRDSDEFADAASVYHVQRPEHEAGMNADRQVFPQLIPAGTKIARFPSLESRVPTSCSLMI